MLARLKATPWFEQLAAVAVVALLALILLCADPRISRNFYYAGVIPLALLAASRLRPAAAMVSLLWWGAIVYCASLLVPPLLTGSTSLADSGDIARRMAALLFFVTLVLCLQARDGRLEQWIFDVLACVAAVAALYALAAFYAVHPLNERLGTVPVIVPHVVGDPLTNPNIAASLHVVIGLGLLHTVVARGPLRGWRLLRIAVLLVLLVFVLAAGSRAVLIGLAAALLASALARSSWRPFALVAVLLAGAYLVLAALGVVAWLPAFLRGDSMRLAIWEQAIELIRQRPWFGHGMTYAAALPVPGGHVVQHPHSIYLSHLLYGGIAGLGALLLLLGLMAREALARYRTDGNFAYGAIVVFIAVQGLFDFTVFGANAGWQWIHFWLPLALMAGQQVAAATRARHGSVTMPGASRPFAQ